MIEFLWFIIGTALVLNLSGKTPLTGYPKVDKGCVYVRIYTRTCTYIFSMIRIYCIDIRKFFCVLENLH